MLTCPNCGYHHRTDFNLDLDAADLTRIQRDIVLRLLQAKGAIVSHDLIVAAVWTDQWDGGPDNALGSLRAHIVHARKKLEPIGWTVKSEWNQGYRLVKQEDHHGS